jgi:hypothetical protein
MAQTSHYPSISAYLDWARGAGCRVVLSTTARFGHPVYQQAEIATADGRRAVAVFVEDDDLLMSTMVAYLDRRLGLKSYLFV